MPDDKTWPGQDAGNVVVDHSALAEFAAHIKAWFQAELDKVRGREMTADAVSSKSVPVYTSTMPEVPAQEFVASAAEASVETHGTTDVG